MRAFIKRITNLLCIKSIITLIMTGVFAFLSVKGHIKPAEFLVIFTVVINFYFETQRNKKSDTEKEEQPTQ